MVEASFVVGQEVEVTIEDDGFNDSWYTAKIIKLANRKAKKKILVEYERLLVDEKESKRLKETVDHSLVRPLPPPQLNLFYVSQIVDAFHNDGWWKGKITGVLENPLRFTVYFPFWDVEFEYGVDMLRVHQDWVDGSWVKPQNPVETELVDSTSGARDEVLDSTSGVGGGVSSELEPFTELVQSSSIEPLTEGSPPASSCPYGSEKRRNWDSFCQYLKYHTPPLTLATCNEVYVIEFLKYLDETRLSKCTYFGHSGSPSPCTCTSKQAWSSLDTLIRQLRAAYEENGGRPDSNPFGSNAVTKYLMEVGNEQGKATELPCAYEKEKKRSRHTKTSTSTSSSMTGVAQVIDNSSDTGGADIVEDIDAEPDQHDVRKTDQAQVLQVSNNAVSTDIAKESDSRKGKIDQCLPKPCKELKKGDVTMGSMSPTADPKITLPATTMNESLSGIFLDLATPTTVGEEAILQNMKDTHPNLTHIFSIPVLEGLSHSLKPTFGQEKFSALDCDNFGHPTFVDRSLSPLSNIKAAESDLSQTRVQLLLKSFSVQLPPHGTKGLGDDEIRPHKGGVGKQTASSLETGGQSKEMVSEASTKDLTYKETADVIQTECTSKVTEITVSEKFRNIEAAQPPSMCPAGSYSSAGVSPDNQPASKSNMASSSFMQESLFDHNIDKMDLENDYLPFVKSYSVWQTLEFDEVFHAIPQNPHFQPLVQEDEVYREGRAIGYMLTFADIANKARRAQLDEPESSLEKNLHALIELEGLGFNVQPVRARLEKLVKLKSSLVQHEGELVQVKEKIIKEKLDDDSLKLKVDENIEKIKALEKSITQMKKKRQMILMEKESQDSTIASLQSMVYKIADDIQSTKHEFDHVAAAPW